MTLPMPTLDHVVINARDEMDAAAETYRRLGFHLTERGYHSLGSMNHLAIFGTDYLELIAVPKGATTGRLDLLGFPAGLNGLVFGTEDSAGAFDALTAAGVPIQPPVEFSRPVQYAGGEADAVFRTVRMQPGVVPAGRVYFCHHFTRHLVWRDEWRRHPNGVVGVVRAVLVERDPAQAAELYARMFGPEVVRDCAGGKTLLVGNSHVDLITAEELRRQFGDGCPDPEGRDSYMAALTFRCASLDVAARALQKGGITAMRREAKRIVVPAESAWNATLEFVA
jgi:catechol 2,3-dioxygenase-like lactoylglutathione lyase family enzyme